MKNIIARFTNTRNLVLSKRTQIDELTNQIEKLEGNNHWTKTLIPQIMEQVSKVYPELDFTKDYVPMGLRSAVSVFGQVEGISVVMLKFFPGNLNDGEIYLAPNKTEPILITDIDQVLNCIKEQILLFKK
jgi:hypothetical protein